METVTCLCGQCGQEMGVHLSSLGTQVECPHCHQVVTASAPPTAAPAPPPEIHAPVTEHESIFGPPSEEVSDDLFGEPTPTPRIEIPSEPAVPNLLLEPIVPAPVPAPPPAEEATVAHHEPAPPPPPEVPPLANAPTVADQFAAPPVHETDEHALAPPAPSTPRRPAAKAGVGVPLLLIFLLPYSVVATIAAGWLIYQRVNQAPPYDPLERLPDPKPGEGGARRIKVDVDIPAKLKTSLKQPLRVGDVEVTPLAVERSDLDDLSLILKLRNVSQDMAFQPISAAFLEYRERGGAPKPYTFVEIGARNIYGGTFEPMTSPQPAKEPKFDRVLNPGEETTVRLRTFNSFAKVVRTLDTFKGQLLWRVQVRRGLVQVKGKDVSATALIGVRINPADIRRTAEEASLARPRATPLQASKSPEFSKATGKVALPPFRALL